MVSVNDIFNKPPTISEDTLQYIIYLPPSQTDVVSATTLATLLLERSQALLPGHLWHRDAFELKVRPDPEGHPEVSVLEGRMRVGDCIDDEWATVWLLRELSRDFDIVISVFDSDGEFLLIEAAEELPSWVTPTNAENRVWIHNSHLHLVPLSHVSPPSSKTRRRKYGTYGDSDDEDDAGADDTESTFIIAGKAVELVRDSLTETRAPENVERAVWSRVADYPSASRNHMHTTRAHLPVDIAKALAVNPALVQKAVETFYTRDGLQLRAAQKMARFPPETAALSSLKMTRTAYAQLTGQKFHPPRVFGRWSEREGTKEWRWRDIGMKIACGFEMLYQESKNRKDVMSANFDGSPEFPTAMKEGLRRNPEYTQYIAKLKDIGYFKDEATESQRWRELEDQAATAFVAARRDDDVTRPSFANVVQAAIGQHSYSSGFPLEDEDSDDWLNVDASDFDAMLEKTTGKDSGKGKAKATDNAMDVDMEADEEDRVAKVQAERLHDLAKKVEEFVEGEGDVEGARFADEAFSDDDGADSDDSDGLDGDNDEEDSDIDEEPLPLTDLFKLTDAQRAQRQAAMDALVPALDPSEYGQMPPSFHSNSQRVAPATVDTDIRDTSTSNKDASAGTSGSTTETALRPIRPPILPRDQYDGVDSDDETDGEDAPVDPEEEEDQPQIVGDVEIDMAEEEEEFIEFARQALGVSDEQWKSILKERHDRGVFAPAYVSSEGKHDLGSRPADNSSVSQSRISHSDDTSAKLDSFEAVMKAMDAELARSRETVTNRSPPTYPEAMDKGKGAARDTDIEASMDAELDELLENDEEFEDEQAGVDYQLIKNFLESFKSQDGSSGPVSSLVGRLQEGWRLPRDDSES